LYPSFSSFNVYKGVFDRQSRCEHYSSRALRKAASKIGPAPSQIDITDDYVKLDRGNLYLIDYALSRIRGNAPFLEIGSFCWLSANLITHYKRKHKLTNRPFTCDKWEFENVDKDHKTIS